DVFDRLSQRAHIGMKHSHPFGVIEAEHGNLVWKRNAYRADCLDGAKCGYIGRRKHSSRAARSEKRRLQRTATTLDRPTAVNHLSVFGQSSLCEGTAIPLYALGNVPELGRRCQNCDV